MVSIRAPFAPGLPTARVRRCDRPCTYLRLGGTQAPPEPRPWRRAIRPDRCKVCCASRAGNRRSDDERAELHGAEAEAAVLDERPEAALHRRRVARRERRRHARRRGPCDRRVARRGRRRARRTTRSRRSRAAADAQAEWAAHPPRERGEILRRAFEAIVDADRRAGAADDARDGQVAGRVARGDLLRRRVLPLVLRGGRAHTRPLHGQHDRQGPDPHDAPAGRAVRVRHAVELPDGDGHAQDRPGDRRRLHDGRQAGAADAAVDARARADPRGGRPARRRAQRDHRQALGRGDRTAAEGPAHAQAVVHRLDRGRAQADRTVGRADPARLDGARRQRAVPRVRGRRPRRRRRGRDAREDAQRRRGVHGRQPLPRARVARRGVRRAAGRADGRAEGRPRHRARTPTSGR